MNNVDVTTLSAELNKFNRTNIENLELQIIELLNDALKVMNMDKTFWKFVDINIQY